MNDIKQIKENIQCGLYTITEKDKGKSLIWKVFGEIRKEDGTRVKDYVFCRTCQKLFKYNNKQSSNLNRHKCYVQSTQQIPFKQITQIDKKKVLDVCSEWVIEDCRPFSAIGGNGFKKMAKHLIEIGARYGDHVNIADILPDRTTISRHIHKKSDLEKEALKDEIKKCVKNGGVTITLDMWTDDFVKRNYICATLHYSQNFELCHFTMGIKSMDFMSSTGQNIKQKMLTLLKEFGVHSFENIKFVTDRGSNIIKALENQIRINCSNHLLSNLLDTAFEDSHELQTLIIACKKLVKYFKKANLQHLLSTSLKNHCPTRWNSYLNMFKSILDNWANIIEILNNKFETHRISTINIVVISSLVKLCTDIDVISRKLQGCSYPTLCFVLPSINRLKCICTAIESEPQVSNLKAKILCNIESKWVSNLNIWHKAASFLFPPTNDIQKDSDAEIKQFCVEEILKMELNDADNSVQNNLSPMESMDEYSLNSNETSPLNSSPVSSPTQPTHGKDIQFFFPELLRASSSSIPESASEEVERYAKEKVFIHSEFDVLKWWSEHSSSYPKLHKLALNVLSIPASSAASERVFSMAGNVITEKRNRLEPSTVDSLIFLNSILKLE